MVLIRSNGQTGAQTFVTFSKKFNKKARRTLHYPIQGL